MVEQICEKCGTRYSMYAPACPSCATPSAQPPKKPGCPQAPAPAARPTKQARAAAEKPVQAESAPAAQSADAQPIAIEGKSECPCAKLAASPFALIGIIAAVFGIFKLLRK